MAEICEVCLTQLKLWKDYVTINYDLEAILCQKCEEEVDELYNKHKCKKEFKKCIEEIRKKEKWRKNENK